MAAPSSGVSTPEAAMAESLQSIATHLESISRSMRTVRRIVWGILISSVLSVLIYGYAAVQMMQGLSGTSLGDLQRQLEGAVNGAGAGGGGGVNNLLEPLRRIQQERQQAQDFLREAEGR